MIKTVTLSQAQYAYDNMAEPEPDYDYEMAMDDTEANRTRLVEQFVTYANMKAAVAAGYADEWIADLIGEPEHSWAVEFVGIELGELA